MKKTYKPILFSTDMVQSVLAGRKTQTRRLHGLQAINKNPDAIGLGNVVFYNNFNFYDLKSEKGIWIQKKYNVGDILWVRETTKVGAWNDEELKIAFDYKASPELKKTPWVEYEFDDDFEKIHQKSIEELDKKAFEPEIDEENERIYYRWKPGESPLNWKSSIFMPKEAARIFLEVTNVRCERLHNISEADAIAEGIESFENSLFNETRYRDYKNGKRRDSDFNMYPDEAKRIGYSHYGGNPWPDWRDPISSFETLWESINGEDSWKYNPWVWVYEFKKIEKPTVWPQ